MKVCFVADVPGWAFDAWASRLTPFFPGAVTAYRFQSLRALLARETPPDYRLPDADVYLHASWWFLWDALRLGTALPPHARHVAVVADAYAPLRSPAAYACAAMRADVLLTQVPGVADALFVPFPVPQAHLDRKRRPRAPDGHLRVGMVANGWRHTGADHKGVGLAREVAAGLPWCLLEVAGTDRLLPSEDMPAWYAGLDVFLTLSVSEGFSNATADALALGCPVIGTPVLPLEPWCSGGYLPVSRDAERVATALTYAWMTVQTGDVLPTCRAVAREWAAERVAEQIRKALT